MEFTTGELDTSLLKDHKGSVSLTAATTPVGRKNTKHMQAARQTHLLRRRKLTKKLHMRTTYNPSTQRGDNSNKI